VTLWFSGCESNSKKRTSIVPEEETIAIVNNKKISLAAFHAKLHSVLNRYRQLILTDEKQLSEIKEIVIEQLVDEELLNQEASRKGIRVSDEEMEPIVAESLTPYEGAGFDTQLKKINMTKTEWKERLRKQLLVRKLIEEEVIRKIPITKREIRSYYQKHQRELVIPEGFKIRNITLSSNEEASAIRSQIRRGKNFIKLIREHSISPDKARDGDLGYIERGDLPLEMERVIFKLGFRKFRSSLSQPIHSQDGYHIFRLEKYRRKRRLSLSAAKSRIKKILIEQKEDEYYARWLEKLKKNATISIDREMLNREEGF
jgi:parvulin-like peptidyl-prolyl isomerase